MNDPTGGQPTEIFLNKSAARGALRAVLALFMTCAMSSAAAGDLTGVLQKVHVTTSPGAETTAFIKISGTTLNKPNCQIDAYQFAFDYSTVTGRALLALAIAAQGSGQVVRAYGTGLCDLFDGVEDLRWIEVGEGRPCR